MTERAALRAMFEQRYRHVSDHAPHGCRQSSSWTLLWPGVVLGQRRDSPAGPKAERTAIDILSVRVHAHIVSGYDPASAKERGNGVGERVMNRLAASAAVGALLLLAGCGTTTSLLPVRRPRPRLRAPSLA
jgi:hypothetical protein